MTKAITKNYIKYYKGNTPIILSAPHGGDAQPKDTKTRTSGVFDKDDYTYELTQLIVEEFYKQTSLTPYAVIAEISREKVDLNRKKSEAFEDEKASLVYNQFHNSIEKSKLEIEEDFGKGLYIDIHGQSHPKAYLEFGYLLDNDILKQHDGALKEHSKKSSISSLSKFSRECFIDQLKGPHSMGSLMCNQGFDSIPSIKLPYASDENYFEGAYNTRTHGSLNGGNIVGIQIEFPYKDVRDTHKNRQKCAKAFVKSLIDFKQVHFDFDFDLRKIS
ncbi:hypothetical protein [Poseidonibacter antarcticus]|uniref:hypothetical protein n=1 Tax=Poseidonibacter antarcticus TaxID=2478538 RepID=UPI000EF4E786|nr:hypothetical protein [Poseidonibacter antarcticus]